MADSSRLPSPSPEHRRIAAERFEHARRAVTSGNHDYAVQLLLICCKLDPANLIYRQELRRNQKAKHKNKLRGGFFAFLTTRKPKAKMKLAKRSRDYVRVLEQGEQVLTRNPWDAGAQLDMAAAAEALGLLDVAIFILTQAREKDAKDVTLNRAKRSSSGSWCGRKRPATPKQHTRRRIWLRARRSSGESTTRRG
jgi:hypothetical protein